jgi:hypothetical protein
MTRATDTLPAPPPDPGTPHRPDRTPLTAPPRPRRRLLADLWLGAGLAVGGGRTSMVRLGLTAVGIGLAVLVLLGAASVPNIVAAQSSREDARDPVMYDAGRPAPPDALALTTMSRYYRGDSIQGAVVWPGGPAALRPPGVNRLPGRDEIVLSPALADLLNSADGQQLRPRFPQRVVGTIAPEGLRNPSELSYFAGDPSVLADRDNRVARFGVDSPVKNAMDPVLWVLILAACAVLLFPVVVFAGLSTRLAAAERDRRLSALRLVGAGPRRVRRIAAGESLVGALAGLLVGAGLFAGVRSMIGVAAAFGMSAFSSDVTPAPVLAVLIALGVPVLAVASSVLSMRRVAVEPLGVFRHSTAVRRRVWWRVAPLGFGIALLAAPLAHVDSATSTWGSVFLLGGILLVLFAVPAVLPWLVERVVSGLRHGAPSWELAIGRLKLDSAAAARLVGGVAVVLAGGIGLQMTMAGVQAHELIPSSSNVAKVYVGVRDGTRSAVLATAGEVDRILATVPGTGQFESTQRLALTGPDGDVDATVADCDWIRRHTGATACTDGDAFVVRTAISYPDRPVLRPGARLTGSPDAGRPGAPTWTLPELHQTTDPEDRFTDGSLLVSPGALGSIDLSGYSVSIIVRPGADLTVGDRVSNAVAPLGWRIDEVFDTGPTTTTRSFDQVRRAVLAAVLVLLLLVAGGLLVLALEQIRERRRPLAVLGACGVPRRTLAAAMFWQNALPLLLSTVFSIGIGMTLGALLLRVLDAPVVFDWPMIGLLSGSSVCLVLLVTAAGLPALWRATGALGLRAE